MLDGAALALLAAGLGVGVVSALTPVLPAEAYVIAVALTHHPALAVAVAVAVAAGQTVGKLVVFSAVRGTGRSRWMGRLRVRFAVGTGPAIAGAPVGPGAPRVGEAPPPRSLWRRYLAGARTWLARAGDVCLAALSGRAGGAVVLLSAAVGLPPLLAVSFIAGASTMRRLTFVPACLLGRAVRFAAVASAPEVFASLLGA